jgi:virginiamycin B lyase
MHPNRRDALIALAALPAAATAQEPKPASRAAERYRLESFIAKIDRKTGESNVIEPPTPRQGARRVWSDSRGRIWVSEWNSGNLSMFDPARDQWRVWPLPGGAQKAYAVYVDDKDVVWVSDWVANTLVRFDPGSESFDAVAMPRPAASVRQILGRPGEVWLPESGNEHIMVVRG